MTFRAALAACALSLCTVPAAIAQAPPKLGVVPVIAPPAPAVYLVDADAGELVGIATLKERPWMMRQSADGSKAYVLTRHYAYAIDTATGDVLTEYQFIEVMDQLPEEDIDPNLSIYPFGVTADGRAFFSFNAPMREWQIAMKKAAASGDLDAMNAANAKMPPMGALPLSIVDIEAQTTEPYLTPRLGSIQLTVGDSAIYVLDQSTASVGEWDIAKKEVGRVMPLNLKAAGADGFNAALAESKSSSFGGVQPIGDGLLNVAVMLSQGAPNVTQITDDVAESLRQMNEITRYTNTMQYYNAYLDAASGEVVGITGPSDMTSATYLMHRNGTRPFYPEAVCDYPPLEQLPMPEMKGNSMKAIEAWQKEMERVTAENQKRSAEHNEAVLDQTRCTLKVYSDPGRQNQVAAAERAKSGTVYNDRYLLVGNGFELAMHDLSTGEQVWNVSLDF